MSILTGLLSVLIAGAINFRSLPLEMTGLNIETICQDRQGNMWYGGIDGLIMYDGNHYSHFKYNTQLEACDPDSHIYSLICDSQGRVWAAHINGLSVFDRKSFSFDSFQSPTGSLTGIVQISASKYLLIAGKQLWYFDGDAKQFTRDGISQKLRELDVNAIYINGESIYIGTMDGHVIRTDESLTDFLELASTGSKVTCILEDASGRLWAGTDGNGLWELSGQPIQIKSGKTDFVKSLCIDRNGLLWIGTKNGLKIMENDEFHVFHYEYDNPGSISHDSICDIFMDLQGTMWLGTYFGGVCYYTSHSSQFNVIASKPGTDGLSGNVISGITEDKDGSLWIGTNSGGLNHMLPDGRFEHISSGGDNPVDVKCIYISPATGRVYVGADRSEILVLDRRKGALKPLGAGGPRSAYGCYAIVGNHRGGFYAGGSDSLYEFDEMSGHFSKIYTSEDISNMKTMMMDSGGILWIGKKYGVSALDTNNGKIVSLPEVLSSIQYVETFLEDASGTIWIGSKNGLYAYDTSSGKIKSYSERDGLPDHVIHGIEEDSSGILWISTDNGLCRMDPSNGDIWTFTTADGLLDNRFTPYAHCTAGNGLVYFGSLHGIISFNPADITMFSEMVSPVISGVEVNGIRRSITDGRLVLKPNERDIAFVFSCPDYISGDNGKFFFKLDGIDADWSEAGKDWRAVYPLLRPGDYTFRLRYRNSSGVSSDTQAILHLRLRAPWYKSYAAKMIGLLLLMLAVVALFIWLLSRKDREYKAQMDKARSDLLREFSLEFVNIGAGKAAESSIAKSFNYSDEAFMRQAMKVAKENIDNPEFSIDSFAEKMLMSRSNLNLRVRALFGISPLDFIKTVRFNEACRLLLESKHSIAEISYKVGFATPSYFTAAFRHFMGCTPSEYVRQNGKK